MSSSEKSEAMLLMLVMVRAVRQGAKDRWWLESRVNPRSGFAFTSDFVQKVPVVDESMRRDLMVDCTAVSQPRL
jgi:hypothetical protein